MKLVPIRDITVNNIWSKSFNNEPVLLTVFHNVENKVHDCVFNEVKFLIGYKILKSK